MERLGSAMLVSYVLGYALLYSLSTLNPSEHNWLPVVPFTSLAAAWVLVRGTAWLVARFPVLRHRAATVTAGIVLVAAVVLLARPVTLSTYRSVVPTTAERAIQLLEQRLVPLFGRIVVVETGGSAERLRREKHGWILQTVESLDRWPPAELDRADALLFAAERLEGERRELYRGRLAGGGVEALRIAPVLFRSRGDEELLLLQPWELVDVPAPLPLVGQGSRQVRCAGRLTGVQAGEAVSLEIVLPKRWQAGALHQVLSQGRPIAARSAGRQGWRRRFFTPRFAVAAPDSEIVIVLSRTLSSCEKIAVKLRRWRR